jgi:hypothetical protein
MSTVAVFPKPRKDPLLSTSFRLIGILPVSSKVWEHTFETFVERNLGQEPFHADQFGFRRRRAMVDALCVVRGIADTCKKRN